MPSLQNKEPCYRVVLIYRLLVWSNDWQMKFNSNKCKILHVGENSPAVLYYIMDAHELKSYGVEKDLGILVDNKLKCDQHINETVKKSNQMFGMIIVIIIIINNIFKAHLGAISASSYDNSLYIIQD